MTKRYFLIRASVLLGQAAAVVLLFVIWQLLSDHNVLDPIYFSKPTVIWDQIRTWFDDGSIWGNLQDTVLVWGLGYAIGTGAGIALGVVIGASEWLNQLLDPFMAFFNAVPRLILLPLMVVWFGFGPTAKAITVVLVILVMVMINVSTGVREVQRDLLNQARLMGGTRLDLIRHVYAPSVGLRVMSTARVTVGYAFNATIAAEFIGANKGLGFLLSYGQDSFQAQEIWAALGLVMILALVIDGVLALVEKRVTRWMPTLA